MEIIIDTSRHCIETGSKNKYEHLLRQYLKSGCSEKEKQILEHNIQALVYFLEHADFSDLRNQYQTRFPDQTSSILVFPENLEHMHIQVKDTVLYPVWKK